MQIPKVNTYKQGINRVGKKSRHEPAGPLALRERPGVVLVQMDQTDQAMEVSSIRKLVPSEESSVPVNASVTVLPA